MVSRRAPGRMGNNMGPLCLSVCLSACFSHMSIAVAPTHSLVSQFRARRTGRYLP